MSNGRSPNHRRNAFLAEFDHIGMGERERARAKSEYLQIEAVIDRIWNLGALIARGVSGRGKH